MARYPNGQIPFDVLVHLGGEWWLSPATNARWQAMVAAAFQRFGVRLQISPGANGYRWLAKQKEAFATSTPGNAAYPGTSSHGGEYQGRDSLAVDAGNWARLPSVDAWHALAREFGFTPGIFDWELWHIVDFNPWWMPSWAGAGGADFITPDSGIDQALLRRRKEQDMYVKGKSNPEIYKVTDDANGDMRFRLATPTEAALAVMEDRVTTVDDGPLMALAAEGNYQRQPKWSQEIVEKVWNGTFVERIVDGKLVKVSALQEIADAKTAAEEAAAGKG